MRHKLDGFDRKLLALIQRDADVTSDRLGEQVGLSASAVQRRLIRLRSTGVIRSVSAIVDPDKIGSPTFFLVGLEIERERAELLTRLRAWLSDEDQVQQVYYVTGEWDFLMVVTAPGVADYERLMSRLISDNPNVRRYTTNVVLGTHKRSLFLPIPTAE